MTRILLAFLSGSLLTCFAAIAADYRLGVMFLAGIVVAALALTAGLASTRRARAVARFLIGVCDSIEQQRKRRPVSESAPLPEGARPDPKTVADLSSALQNFGMKKKQAATVAAQSVSAGGSFEEMVRRATSRPN